MAHKIAIRNLNVTSYCQGVSVFIYKALNTEVVEVCNPQFMQELKELANGMITLGDIIHFCCKDGLVTAYCTPEDGILRYKIEIQKFTL